MATRWGICSAGKISHDFTVALKTLPAEDHQVLLVEAHTLSNYTRQRQCSSPGHKEPKGNVQSVRKLV